MTIINSPAYDLDTLNTAVQRFMHIFDELGQRYVVVTADQALYNKLMEL